MLPFLLLLPLLATAVSPVATGPAATYPATQLLNVKDTIKETETRPSILPQDLDIHENYPTFDHSSSQSQWKLKLFHRDKLPLNFDPDHRRRFKERIERDSKRVSSLLRQLSNGSDEQVIRGEAKKEGGRQLPSFEFIRTYSILLQILYIKNVGMEILLFLSDLVVALQVTDFGSDVVSGTEQGSGEYFVRIGVGSPPRSQYVVIDSGSDIVWVQCQPCSECYQQSDPVFDPAGSASYAGISCDSSVCDRLDNAGCNDGRCRYEVSYGDGSYTRGTLALETLTFGRVVIRNIAIGCGHMNRGMFVGAAGLLGLGGGAMSFVGQLGGQTGGAFSYCLVSRGTESTGTLEFGRGAMPVGGAWVPLIRNPRAPSFYYVGLSGLGVGGIRVPIPEQIFELTDLGYGGVVMDTGTAVTRLPAPAYEAFRDTFIGQTANLPRSGRVSIFDTCYNLNGFVSVRVPTVSFYFSGGPILTLPARNFLIPVDSEGTFCFAFAASASGLSIIGNIQQEGIQISIDGSNGFVGFGPSIC